MTPNQCLKGASLITENGTILKVNFSFGFITNYVIRMVLYGQQSLDISPFVIQFLPVSCTI